MNLVDAFWEKMEAYSRENETVEYEDEDDLVIDDDSED